MNEYGSFHILKKMREKVVDDLEEWAKRNKKKLKKQEKMGLEVEGKREQKTNVKWTEKWNLAMNCMQIEIWHNVVLFMPQTKSAKSANYSNKSGCECGCVW